MLKLIILLVAVSVCNSTTVFFPSGFSTSTASSTKCEVNENDNSTCTYHAVTDSFSLHMDINKIKLQTEFNAKAIKSIRFEDSFMDNIPKELTEVYSNLQFLDVSHCNLERLEAYDFALNNNLKFFNASNNQVEKLGANLMKEMKQLEVLDLSHNLISRINPTTFVYNPLFKHLNLSHNRIAKLDAKFIEPLRSLEVLRLDHNYITDISGHYANLKPRWKELYLQHNRLIALEPSLTASVLILDLSLNQLKEARLKSTKLIELYISQNELKMLELGSSLEKLDASGNNEKFLRIVFEDKVNLKHLDLSNTKLKASDDVWGFISKFTNLVYLDLSGVEINFDKNMLKGFPSLQTLKLADTKIKRIPQKAFVNLKELISLDLSQNQFDSFDFDELKSCPGLTTINLRNGNVQELIGWEQVKTLLPNLTEVDLYNNQLTCEKMKKMENSFERHNIELKNSEDVGEGEEGDEGCLKVEPTPERTTPSFQTFTDENLNSSYVSSIIAVFLICLIVVGVVIGEKKFDIFSNILSRFRSSSSYPRSPFLGMNDDA